MRTVKIAPNPNTSRSVAYVINQGGVVAAVSSVGARRMVDGLKTDACVEEADLDDILGHLVGEQLALERDFLHR